MADILVVDDDDTIAKAFEQFLRLEGHAARFASNAEEGIAMVSLRAPTLVFMDIRMPGVDGLQALTRLKRQFPDVPVVMMTGYGTSQTSIDAIRAGAFDYLTKPFDLDELRRVIDRVLATEAIRSADPGRIGDDDLDARRAALVGESPAMKAVYKMIGRLATNDAPALVVGEPGTGKRLVCATIHDNSPRNGQPFVSIDCEALGADAIESALFGAQAGTVELAHAESLPKPVQARLAEALTDDRAPDGPGRQGIRVLASTSLDLADRVRQGTFNWDLYHALSLITLTLPPLRDRRDDIPMLIRRFIARFNVVLNRNIRGVDDRVSRLLKDHGWPGNVAELESVIKRACIVAKSDVITLDDVGNSLSEGHFAERGDIEGALSRAAKTALRDYLTASGRDSSSSPFHEIVELVEATLVSEALAITNGNQVKAAELLGVNRMTLRKKSHRDED